MLTDLNKRMTALADRLFPERQLFVRSEGRVHYLALTRRLQLAMVVLCVVAVAGIAWSTYRALLSDHIIVAKNDRIDRLEEANDTVSDQLEKTTDQLARISREIEEKSLQMAAMLEQQSVLDRRITETTTQLRDAAAERDAAHQLNRGLEKRVGSLETDLRTEVERTASLEAKLSEAADQLTALSEENDNWRKTSEEIQQQANALSDSLTAERETRASVEARLAETEQTLTLTTEERNSALQTGEQLSQRVAELTGDLENTRSRHDRVARALTTTQQRLDATAANRDTVQLQLKTLRKQVASLSSTLADADKNRVAKETRMSATGQRFARLAAAREQAERRAELLANQLVHLQSQLSGVKYHQRELFGWLQGQIARDTDRAERSLAMTGLDIAELTSAATGLPYGQGGPLVIADAPNVENSDWTLAGSGFQDHVTELELQLVRWNGLQNLIKQMPLGKPTDRGWVSSRYGKRRDPFNNRWAMHAGLDISAPRKTSVHSTAPGTVTFARRNGPFGNMVEIDHGLGFKTRYAHLHKILVKKGQKVSFRHKIGLMGSTGRSSGSHVHYEVSYRGKTQDPLKFFEAGTYVFQERKD